MTEMEILISYSDIHVNKEHAEMITRIYCDDSIAMWVFQHNTGLTALQCGSPPPQYCDDSIAMWVPPPPQIL